MQPAYSIVADGVNITALIIDRLLSAEITDQAGVKSDRLTLVIDDRDQRLELPKTGAKIEVSLGYVGQALVKMGSYVVDEVDVAGPVREMTIRANAANMTADIKAPKERSFDSITLGDLVKTIASDNNLIPAVASDLASRQLGHVDQTESDMHLLQRICANHGATCKVADGRLVVAKRAGGKSAAGSDLPMALILVGQCESWTAVISKRNDYKSVKAYYQNVGSAERVAVTAGSGKPAMSLKNSYTDQVEAQRAAESKLQSLKRGGGKVAISGLIGDPTMSAERPATLVGFRAGVDGQDWVINKVTHNFSDAGYTCNLDLEVQGEVSEEE